MCIRDRDFIIRVRPFANDDGAWSGEVDISIMAMPNNPLEDEDYSKLMHFTKMMCAAVPVMEEVTDLRDVVHEYVVNVIDREMEISVELEEEAAIDTRMEELESRFGYIQPPYLTKHPLERVFL